MDQPLLQFQKSVPPIIAIDIMRLEKKLNTPLPDDYKDFMLRYNGARPFWPNIDAYAAFKIDWIGPIGGAFGDEGLVGDFYSIKPEKLDDDGLSDFEIFDIWSNPNEGRVVTIGMDPGGNPILLCLSGPNKGKILYTYLYHLWTAHDQADPPAERDNPEAQIGIIGNSFGDFIQRLFPFPYNEQ